VLCQIVYLIALAGVGDGSNHKMRLVPCPFSWLEGVERTTTAVFDGDGLVQRLGVVTGTQRLLQIPSIQFLHMAFPHKLLRAQC